MPDGMTYSYTYNANNELTIYGEIEVIAGYGYDPFGWPLWKEINSIKTVYAHTYDNVSNILTNSTEHGNYTWNCRIISGNAILPYWLRR